MQTIRLAPFLGFVGLVLGGAATGAAETTPRGLVKVKGAPETSSPAELASFAAG